MGKGFRNEHGKTTKHAETGFTLKVKLVSITILQRNRLPKIGGVKSET